MIYQIPRRPSICAVTTLAESESNSFLSTSPSVCLLDLTKNRIYEIEDEAFAGLATLWTLDLCSNDLTELRSNTFYGLSHLKTLTLSYNKISTIHPGAFKNLSYLMHLVLIHNELTTLDGEAFADLPRPVQLSVAENPLVCDRKLCWLKQDIDNRNIPWFDCNRPICTDGTVLTNCKVEGKKTRARIITCL